jgi:3-oxoacyl-[acyl-carrier protein] reductase
MNLNLKGKRALVCGSSQGIGKAVAEELALLGADITLFARNKSALEEVKSSLNNSAGQQHEILLADFSKPEEVKKAIDAYLKDGKIISILINNTGGPKGGPVINAALSEFVATFEAHLLVNQLLTQAVFPGMQKQVYGRIINIISTSVKVPIQGLGVSNTIRGAVASWAKTMANELGPYGITVNNVLPGYTETARLDSLLSSKAQTMGKSEKELADAMKAEIPARRFGTAHEIAASAAFLASPAAAYINGINLPVDGGRTGSL